MARQTIVVLLVIIATAANLCAMAKAHPSHHKNSGCPFGWKKFGLRCYKYQATSTDWAAAENICLSLGGHLVSIHSREEYQVVKAIIRANDPQENPTWIGLSGAQKRNNFFWSDGTKLVFTKWNPGEPNFVGGAEGCVHMNWPSPKDWNDIPCDRNYPFVCVKKSI